MLKLKENRVTSRFVTQLQRVRKAYVVVTNSDLQKARASEDLSFNIRVSKVIEKIGSMFFYGRSP